MINKASKNGQKQQMSDVLNDYLQALLEIEEVKSDLVFSANLSCFVGAGCSSQGTNVEGDSNSPR